MSYAEFNPAKCLRELDSEAAASLIAKLGAASLSELREANARRSGIYLSDAAIAALWAINLEFTRRGVGPRWRGIERFNPSAVPHERPDWMPVNVPSLRTPQMQQKLLLRWADLQWLHHELGPSHLPNNLTWRDLFAQRLDEGRREELFAQIAASERAPHWLVHDLAVNGPHKLALRGFAVSEAGDRIRAMRKRLKDVIQPRLEGYGTRTTYSPSPAALSNRLMYAEAIELAQGSPTETARFVRWISGMRIKPQAAHQMRNKIAADLKLRGRAWQ